MRNCCYNDIKQVLKITWPVYCERCNESVEGIKIIITKYIKSKKKQKKILEYKLLNKVHVTRIGHIYRR